MSSAHAYLRILRALEDLPPNVCAWRQPEVQFFAMALREEIQDLAQGGFIALDDEDRVKRLTNRGHDFLAHACAPGAWEDAQTIATGIGGDLWPGLLHEILAGICAQRLGLTDGHWKKT